MRDGVAAADAEARQAAGDALDAVAVLRPGDGHLVAGRAQGDGLRPRGGGQLERLRERAGVQRRVVLDGSFGERHDRER